MKKRKKMIDKQAKIIGEHEKTLYKGERSKKYMDISKKVVMNTNNIWLLGELRPSRLLILLKQY
jgi:hypothetical protein